jgi:hypothetical protein
MRANDTWATALRDLGTVFVAAMVMLGTLGGVGGFVGGASAATVVVANGESIQDAVNVANAGDTITIRAGTYDETVTIDTNSITLNGPNAGTPGDSSARSKAEATITGGVEVKKSGVTIDGLKIRNPGVQGNADPNSFSGAVGVNIQSSATGVTVKNNVLTEIGTDDDDANPIAVLASDGTSDLTVSDNLISNLEGTDEDEGAVHAVQVIETGTEITGVSVNDNTITGLLDTRSTVAVRFNGGVSGEIKNNDISDLNTEGTIPGSGGDPGGFTQVIALSKGANAQFSPSSVTIEGNQISDIETTTKDNFARPSHIIVGSNAAGNTISIESNDFSANSPDTDVYIEDGSGNLDLDQIETDNTFTPAVTQITSGSLLVPATGRVENVDQNTGFNSIQSAVDAADPGDTIEVGPGTFKESVTISTEKLTLEGPNAGTPGDGDRDAEATIEQGMMITADGVTIDGVEVTNDDTNGILLGPTAAPSDVVVTNTVVRDIEGGTAGSTKGVGNGINLQFNDVSNTKSSGVEITDNLITGISTPDVGGSGSDADAIGVQVLPRGNDVQGLLIEGNVIKNIQPGTATSGRSEARAVSIDTQFKNGNNRFDRGRVDDATIRNNKISGLTADFARAISLFEDTEGSVSDPGNAIGPKNFEISQNTVSDVTSEDSGLSSLSIFIGKYDEFGTDEIVNDNILLAGVENFGSGSDTLETTDNWWGATDGPSGSGFNGNGAKILGGGTTKVNPAGVSTGSVDLENPFIGTITDPETELTTVANADAGFTIDNKLGGPADGTLVLRIAGTEYVFQDALDSGKLTSTASSSKVPTDIANTAATGERTISVVGSGSSTAIADAGTVRLVHEAQGIGSGYTLSSVPQPARIYTDEVSDITAWDNDNSNFESTTATVDDGTLVTDGEALHKGQYFFGDTADARVGYDYLEDGESAIQVGAGGVETLDEGFHLIGSNYDTSSTSAPISLNKDLASVKNLPGTLGDYDGSESFVAYDTVSFGELGGDETIGSFEAYWVYVDVGEDSETRIIKLARFNPSDA